MQLIKRTQCKLRPCSSETLPLTSLLRPSSLRWHRQKASKSRSGWANAILAGVDFVAILRLFLTRARVQFAARDEVRAVSRLKCRLQSFGGHFVVDFFVAVD